ncbi:MAG: GGDEF domain-containing protein [Bryobacteraceae bacterium]
MDLELNPDIFRALVEDSPNGIYLTDRKRQIVFWNASAERITGYLGQEVIGHLCHDNLLMHCDENHLALCGGDCPMAYTMQDGRPREAHIFLRHKQGQRVPVRVRSIPLRDEFGVIIGAAEIFEERSFQHADRRRPSRPEQVSIDSITGVADGGGTLAVLAKAMESFAASQISFGALAVAIDNLPHLRRVYGCQAVNEVLWATAQTLAGGTRPEDMVGRLGEDRFAVLVVCPAADGLRVCAERLKRLVSLAAVPWWGDRLSFTASMGGSMVRLEDTKDSLLARAQEALERSLAAGADAVLVV